MLSFRTSVLQGREHVRHCLLIAWAAFSAGAGAGFVVCALFMGGNRDAR